MLPEMEKFLIETLIRGKQSANLLQNLRRRKVTGDGSVSVDDLVTIIMKSFSDSLSMVISCDSGELSSDPASHQMGLGLGCPVDRQPEVLTGDTGKKPAPAVRERRGGYKRRKTKDSRINIRDTIEDGYAWRKYGQKVILNSKFPRCYFRCTHKKFHGCKALKQVQKLEDESNKYHITYFGHHTCPAQHVLSHSGVFLDFKGSKTHQYLPSTPATITNVHIDPLVKLEDDSKAQSDNFSDNVSSANHAQSSPAWWKEILIDEVNPCMGFEFDHEDSCASTSSHGYLDIAFSECEDFFGDIQLDDPSFRLM